MANFNEVYGINVNDKVETKNGLNYLSWAYAWAEFKKIYPNATYEIKMFDNKPYIYDEALGYMVFTSVTADELTYEMWLPVMDGANKAMKSQPYTYTTKWGEKNVEQATMFDVNKTVMRCLVKNLAMFGLGLYIYSGEDLPETIPQTITSEQAKTLKNVLASVIDENQTLELLNQYKVTKIEDLNVDQYGDILRRINKK